MRLIAFSLIDPSKCADRRRSRWFVTTLDTSSESQWASMLPHCGLMIAEMQVEPFVLQKGQTLDGGRAASRASMHGPVKLCIDLHTVVDFTLIPPFLARTEGNRSMPQFIGHQWLIAFHADAIWLGAELRSPPR